MTNDKQNADPATLLPIAEKTLQQTERIAACAAQLILMLKRSDERHANRSLQSQADMNHLRDLVTTLQSQVANLDRQVLGMIDHPEVLAAMVPKVTIDAARQIARKAELADASGREDDSLVNIKLPGSKTLIPVSNKWLFRVLFGTVAGGLGWLVHMLTAHHW